jgi:hypothetical protein
VVGVLEEIGKHSKTLQHSIASETSATDSRSSGSQQYFSRGGTFESRELKSVAQATSDAVCSDGST